MIYHYIYKITCLCGSLKDHYYIGKHSTRDISDLSKDYYTGSGKIIKNYFAKYGKIKNITYIKEILEYNSTKEINASREKFLIGDLYKQDSLCLNLKCGGEGGGWEKGMTAINKGKKATDEHRKHQSEAQYKPVLQYDLEGNFIKEWGSEKEADAYYNGRAINKVVKGKEKTCYGFMWKLKAGKIEDKIEPYCNKKEKKINQYSKEGVFIKEWDSLSAAANSCGVSIGAIYNALKRRNRCKASAGYIWKYA